MVLLLAMMAVFFLWKCIQLWRKKNDLNLPKVQALADLCALSVLVGGYLLIKWNCFLDTGFDFQTVVERINPYLLLGTFLSFLYLVYFYPRVERLPQGADLYDKVQFEIEQHRGFPLVLAILSGLLVVGHFLAWRFQNNSQWKWSLLFVANEFNLDNENVLPAYFSGLLLLLAAVLLGYLAISKFREKETFRFQWALLAVIFVYLSVDEVVHGHESWSIPVTGLFPNPRFFYFAWIPSAIIALLLFGLFFFRFFLNLPRRAKWLFVLSGALYVGGALGMEMVSGHYMAVFNEWGFDYWRLVAVEESMEMLGIVLFIYTLLDTIEKRKLQAIHLHRQIN